MYAHFNSISKEIGDLVVCIVNEVLYFSNSIFNSQLYKVYIFRT